MTNKYKFSMVLTVLMVAQSVPLNVMAFNLSTNSKKSSLSAPVYAKLESSSSSTSDTTQTAPDLSTIKLDDAESKPAAAEPAKVTSEKTAESTSIVPAADDQSMAPVTANTAPAADGDASTLNASVEKEGFVPKPPMESTATVVGEESVVSAKDKKKQAKTEAYEKAVRETANKVGPIELQESDDEMRSKVVTIVDAEKAELAEIWDAALCRSQDIQFVVQKLMPSKDPKHSTAVMMKMLSTAMYGAVAAGGMMGGSAMGTGGYMAQSAGASLVMSVLNQVQTRSQRKMAVTETEAIMLYKMIRDVGREVSHDFHDYKKNISQVGRACTDYEDLQKMVSDARAGQDAGKQIEMDFLLRRARREIDGLNEDARHSREALVVLSGAEAVDILDKQIAIESQKIGQPIASEDDIPKEPEDNGLKPAKGKLASKEASTDAAEEQTADADAKQIAEAPKKRKAAAKVKPADQETSAEDDDAAKANADKSSDKPL